MSKIITRPAAIVKQGQLTLYSTSLKVSDLLIPKFYSVETLDPEDDNDKGYQRLLNRARAKRLADYIIDGQETKDAFLPTSVFMATHKNIDFNTTNNTIEINIDEIGPFSVVDGQHRVEGLRMAAEKDDRVLDFEVPVNIAINLPRIAQMCHFLIVNTTQKSVEKGVEQRIYQRLTQSLEVEDIPNLPKWISKTVQKGEDDLALNYVDFLNTNTTQIDTLIILSKRAVCPITNVNISMQKDNSILLSHTGLKYYFKNDKKIFEQIKRKYLTKVWFNSDFDTQIKEIAHNIRNAKSNQSIKQKAIYKPNQTNLLNQFY